MTLFFQIFEIRMEAFPGALVCALVAQDPSRWCGRGASPSWYVVQAAFEMRDVLPWIKPGPAETSAVLWSFLKPAGWDPAGGQRQEILPGRWQDEPWFLIARPRVGANS